MRLAGLGKMEAFRFNFYFMFDLQYKNDRKYTVFLLVGHHIASPSTIFQQPIRVIFCIIVFAIVMLAVASNRLC